MERRADKARFWREARRREMQVESEAIAEIDYVPASAILLVRFVDGDWYSYFNVPPNIHAAFVSAESHGRFFHERIRDRYAYRRGRWASS
jgi:hypothetical protein